jgi:Protein of unknown function (DUF1320)
MSYISWQDLVSRYPDIAKNNQGATIVNSSVIFGAEAEVNGRLAKTYTVPFTPCPDIVKDLCIDIAYYKLSWRQKNIKPLKDSIDDRVLGLLNGTLLPTDPISGVAIQQADQGVFTDRNFGSSFGVDDDVNWRVSSDWAQSFKDARDLGP